jgi:hypothetical protein
VDAAGPLVLRLAADLVERDRADARRAELEPPRLLSRWTAAALAPFVDGRTVLASDLLVRWPLACPPWTFFGGKYLMAGAAVRSVVLTDRAAPFEAGAVRVAILAAAGVADWPRFFLAAAEAVLAFSGARVGLAVEDFRATGAFEFLLLAPRLPAAAFDAARAVFFDFGSTASLEFAALGFRVCARPG